MFPPKVTIQQRSWSLLLMKVLKRLSDRFFIFHIFCWCKFISSVLISIMFQSSLCFEGKPKNSRMIWNHVFYRLSFYIINSTCRNWVNLTFPDFGPSEIKHVFECSSSGDIRFKQACQDDGAHHSEASACSQEIWLANAGCQRRNWIHTLGTNRWRWLRDRRNFLMLEDGTSFLQNDSVNNQFSSSIKNLMALPKRWIHHSRLFLSSHPHWHEWTTCIIWILPEHCIR